MLTSKGGLDAQILDQGKNLSEGEKYRISLARALLADNKVLLLDEPFAALDDISIRSVVKTLNSIKKSKFVVLVSHLTPHQLNVDATIDFENLNPSNPTPTLKDSAKVGSKR